MRVHIVLGINSHPSGHRPLYGLTEVFVQEQHAKNFVADQRALPDPPYDEYVIVPRTLRTDWKS